MRALLFLGTAAIAVVLLFHAFPESTSQEGIVPESPGMVLLTIVLAAFLTVLHHLLFFRHGAALKETSR